MLLADSPAIYFLMIILSPLLGLITNLLFFRKNPLIGSKITTLGVWIGFVNSLISWALGLPFHEKKASLGFLANEISWLMAALFLFISATVHHFSLRYMSGDRNYRRYFLLLNLITITSLLTVISDNIFILIGTWSFSNMLLVLLMMHKLNWLAAKNSGILAIKTFLIGLAFLSAGIGLLAYYTESLSLNVILEKSETLSASTRTLALLFLMLASFSQSGCWPFHSWLISSLNSPTPVSAFMHAGLVNGGGLLLIRFAPIFLLESFVLDLLFIFAFITLILGGIWKLLQSDIKRMLACSTMTQMGFMMMQCALGLFPAALSHLCWHGLFKAFLFLRSGSTVAEHRPINEERISTIPIFLLSSLCGLIATVGFVFGGALPFNLDTTAILIFFCWMASTQFAHALIQKRPSLFSFLTAILFCFVTALIYGLNVNLVETAIEPLQIFRPKPLNSFHIIGVIFIFCIWIALNLKPLANHEGSLWWRRFYVRMLNASQPDPKTTTSGKNGYKF